jgi:hypothetical protein
MMGKADNKRAWPVLEWHQWRDTAETLHMMTQIVGKTRLALTPLRNHWWNVPLYVTARGLSTSVMPLPDGELFEIEFDFQDHLLHFRHSAQKQAALPLHAQSVAEFYAQYRRTLISLGVPSVIKTLPVECPDPIRFDVDTTHGSYDPDAVHRFWRVLGLAETIFKAFSGNFYGKISPVHFFWGSFDLAVTRFNGLRAPPRPGADPIQAEAYSHVCISAGFWPGNGGYGRAAFYCYAAPVPPGLGDKPLSSLGGFDARMGEFLLDYSDVQTAPDPAATVITFLKATYSACADAAGWDRAVLDRIDVGAAGPAS